MNSKEIDILNIILIVVSLAVAFQVPFGLLIFSYAFLGPLHYLTEINWLKEKQYFVKETKWIWLFIILASIVTIPVMLKLNTFSGFNKITWIKTISDFANQAYDEVIMILLLLAIGLIYFKNKLHLTLFLSISIVLSISVLHYFSDFAIFISIFIPTLIHVFIFTLLFMIYGTMKSKTTPGIIAIVLLALTPLFIMMSKINPMDYANVSAYTIDSYNKSNFTVLNTQIAKWFIPVEGNSFRLLSVLGIKIQIFVAFAYTYHYLNWFSKTSIIRWDKNLSRSKVITILSIWGICLLVYLYNFRVGFIVLTFISLLHVFLEFPLNMTSIREIIHKIKPRSA